MQRRTLWIVIGSIVAVLLLLCGVTAVVGVFVLRQTQQLADLTTNMNATVAALPQSIPGATPSTVAVPSATPRATPQAPTAAPTAETAQAPSAAPTAAPATTPDVAGADQPAVDVSAALIADSRDALAQRPEATLYQIEATLDPDTNTIVGTQTIRLTNTEDTALNEVYLRLYVNATHYKEGGIVVDQVQINGVAPQTALEIDDTALKIVLPQPLAQGATTEINLRFTTTVPSSGGGYGIFNESEGVYTLYNWHPELAVYENGGWLLNPVTDQGDPTNTDASNYQVNFAVPERYTLITSGVETETAAADGEVIHTAVAALARNFVIVTSDRFQSTSQQLGETKVTSYYYAEDAAGGQAVLDTTVKSLELFGAQFGAYPYTEMDVAQVSLGGGAAGMESTGLIMIGARYYDPEEGQPLAGVGDMIEGAKGGDVLAFTTAHEVAHQWWYGVVGSDAYRQPWLDESLTNWSSALYVDRVINPEAGLLARDLFIRLPYQEALDRGDQRLDQPVDQFDGSSYGSIVYGKGALMYDVLRQELGDDAFFAFLQRYYAEQKFDRADSAEWLQTLNAAAGRDMTPFYEQWIEGSSIEPSDLPPGGALSDLLSGNLGFDELLPDASPAP